MTWCSSSISEQGYSERNRMVNRVYRLYPELAAWNLFLLNVSLEPEPERLIICSGPDLEIMNLKEKCVQIRCQAK